ncbi:aminoglycoside 6'-N-acetyltransferase [Methyloligella sp. 2.7D]|uniref:aminoglycoside 6'-N-acetyltransferase n=1 Tax=unclassified Methyloligella TaxID=2625955 RepID=UPI00157E01C1|nr:aminoglycoside 6'-N-acetyltransferase [Methyloligella sp. GL2]QKP78501.1 GNAT family N-acetyltransferase [Methyloligella sp. GL2]
MQIIRCSPDTLDAWLGLRAQLWPDSRETHRKEAEALLARADAAAFLALREDGEALGFAEVALRHDYVNGCKTSPVAFLEGLFVAGDARGQGRARALVAAVEAWVAEQNVSELASDVLLNNKASQKMHQSLGFQETERVVFYRKAVLPPR